MKKLLAGVATALAIAACQPSQHSPSAPVQDTRYSDCIDAIVGNSDIPTQPVMDYCNQLYPTSN